MIEAIEEDQGKPKEEKLWALFPYELHCVVLGFMKEARDVEAYLTAFKSCKTIGDLTKILHVKHLTRLSVFDIWPTLRLRVAHLMVDGFVNGLTRTPIRSLR